MRRIATYFALMVASAIIGSAAGAVGLFGAEGEFSTSYLSDLEYDPTGACTKPIRPFSNGDEYAWSNYRVYAEMYLDCLQRTAESDAEYAQSVVQEGYNDAVDEFLDEVRTGY